MDAVPVRGVSRFASCIPSQWMFDGATARCDHESTRQQSLVHHCLDSKSSLSIGGPLNPASQAGYILCLSLQRKCRCMVGASAYCLTIDSSNVSGVSEGAAALLMRGQMGNELGPERLEGFFDRPFYTRNKRSLFTALSLSLYTALQNYYT